MMLLLSCICFFYMTVYILSGAAVEIYYSRLHLSRRRLSRYSLKSIMISWNIPISSYFHVKLEPLSRCRLSRHDGQVDLLILPHVGSVL